MKQPDILRGMVLGKYKSLTKAARALGWHPQRLRRILDGAQLPNVADLSALAKALGSTAAEITTLFVPEEEAPPDG